MVSNISRKYTLVKDYLDLYTSNICFYATCNINGKYITECICYTKYR